MINMDTKGKPLFALNETARTNEFNDIYLCFNKEIVSECAAVLENVAFDINTDRILIEPHTVTKVFKTTNTNKTGF